MRPRASLPRLFSAARRAKATWSQESLVTSEKHKKGSLFELDPDESATALGGGMDLPEGIPQRPPHLDQLSPRRLKSLERTTDKVRLRPEDAAFVEQVMNRNKLPVRPKIEFASGDSGPTKERLEFFGDAEAGGPIEAAEDIAGVESGRIIEVRRNGMAKLALLLTTVLNAGRKRLLCLLSTGEIWPVGEGDVSFVMPKSLVSPELFSKCWTPELLQLWASGKDIGIAEQGAEEGIIGSTQAAEMFVARRKVATIMRKVARETERMGARIAGGSVANGRGGGMEAVWEHFAPQDREVRTGVTATEVAEFLLNAPGTPADKKVVVRPNTLPAFAAHSLLMSRPDLFIASYRDMWKSGFMVRSRGDRARIEKVANAVETDSDMFKRFVAKAKEVQEALKGGKEAPGWNEDDLDIIWLLTLTFIETRSTQAFVALPLAAAIVKAFDYHVRLDKHAADITAPLLASIGVLPPGDSVRTSLMHESAMRSMATAGLRPEVSTADLSVPTAADAALDPLRQDFSHRVFVIDDQHAKELDDGIAVEPTDNGDFWIHVHVADPTRYLSRDDPVATTARFVGASSYFAEGSTPLLPRNMGSDDMSLGESSKSQAVMVFSARVDKQGNIHDHKVSLGNLGSAVLTTYAAVNEALGIKVPPNQHPLGILSRPTEAPPRKHSELTPADIESLGLLRDLACALRAKRFATSGVELYLPLGQTIPVGGTPPLANIMDRTTYSTTIKSQALRPIDYDHILPAALPAVSAELTVAELMVLANRVVAQFCGERGIPVPFRGSPRLLETSGTPSNLTLEKLLARREPGTGMVDYLAVQAANLTPPEAGVSSTPIDHWIMGLSHASPYGAYVRGTSPLRRFDDMLVHWQIKAALAAEAKISGKAADILPEDKVVEITGHSDAALSRLKVLEKTSRTYWNAGLLLSRASGPVPSNVTNCEVDVHDMEAVVLGLPDGHDVRVEIYIPSLGVRCHLRTLDKLREKDLVVGARVRVKVDTEDSRQWPNPVINTVPVSLDIVPPNPF